MEQNASGVNSVPANLPPTENRKRNFMPLAIIAFILITSMAVSGVYFFYTRVYSNDSNTETEAVTASDDVNAEFENNDDWNKFTYDDASISFYHPNDLSAVEIDSGLSVSKDGETVMEIRYGQIGSRSLSEYVSLVSDSDSEAELVQIRQKVGLGIVEDNINYRYFPGFNDNFIVIEIFNTDPETNELVETIIQSIEFLPPTTASSS